VSGYYINSRSENRRDGPPAEELGLVGKALMVKEIPWERHFPDRVGIAAWLSHCYFGGIPTRALENGVAHTGKRHSC